MCLFQKFSLPLCLSLEVANNSSSNAARLWLHTLCCFLWRCQWANTQRDTERDGDKESRKRKASPPWRRALGKLSELDAEQRLFPFRHLQWELRECEMNNNEGHFMKHIYLCEAPVKREIIFNEGKAGRQWHFSFICHDFEYYNPTGNSKLYCIG